MIECKSDTSSCNNIFSGLNFLQPFCVKITDFNFPNIFQPLFGDLVFVGTNLCFFDQTHISTWRSYYTQLSATCLVIQLLPIMFSDLDSCAVIENKYFSYFPIQACIPKLILSIILFPSNFWRLLICATTIHLSLANQWSHFDEQSFFVLFMWLHKNSENILNFIYRFLLHMRRLMFTNILQHL